MQNDILKRIQEQRPIVHCITNSVTINDCANILLAAGASPIMADEAEEMEDMEKIASALVLNIGTLSRRTVESMHIAGRAANAQGIPVVLDPVGVGATTVRLEAANRLLENVRFAAIRGNISEIKTLDEQTRSSHGVDAAAEDTNAADDLAGPLALARRLAKRLDTVIVISGAVDVLAEPTGRALHVRNGDALMGRVTGTGCMSTAILAACAAVSEDKLTAACTAACAMGVAGEIAKRRLSELDGNASYRNYLIDAIFHLTDEALEQEARYELFD